MHLGKQFRSSLFWVCIAYGVALMTFDAHATTDATAIISNVQENTQATVYTSLANLYLPSLENLRFKEDQESAALDKKNEECLRQGFSSSTSIQLPGVGSVESYQVLCRLFDAYFSKRQEVRSSVLDDHVFHDLEVLCGPNDDLLKNVFQAIDYTVTTMGAIQLQRWLYEPQVDRLALEQRQAVVSVLLANERLLRDFDAQLRRIKAAEGDILWFWKNIQSLVRRLTEVGQTSGVLGINKSSVASEAYKWSLDVCLPFYMPLMMLVSVSFLGSVMPSSTIGLMLGDGLYNGLRGTYYVYSMYDLVQFERVVNHVRKNMHTKMNAVAALCSASKVMGTAIHDHAAFNILFPHADALRNVVDKQTAETQALLDLLATNTFSEEPSFWSRQGRVIAAFNMMRDVKDSFIGTMTIIGQLDAYVSIAKLYKKYAHHEHVHFSFARYQQADKPHVALHNFWHPTLNPAKVVVNSIELGAQGAARVAVITGPPAGGKSITLKAITLCILLAQTIGIVPADAMMFTPFDCIKTYMKMTDKVGLASLFQAEVRQSNELLKTTRMLAATKGFAFLASDELLTGTTMNSGEAGAYGYASAITSLDNVIAVFATHFRGLTDLAKDTHGKIANYKVTVEYQPDGSYISPYTIVPGISNQDIGLDVLRQEHADPAVLEAAYAFLKRKQAQSKVPLFEEPAALQVVAAAPAA